MVVVFVAFCGTRRNRSTRKRKHKSKEQRSWKVYSYIVRAVIAWLVAWFLYLDHFVVLVRDLVCWCVKSRVIANWWFDPICSWLFFFAQVNPLCSGNFAEFSDAACTFALQFDMSSVGLLFFCTCVVRPLLFVVCASYVVTLWLCHVSSLVCVLPSRNDAFTRFADDAVAMVD